MWVGMGGQRLRRHNFLHLNIDNAKYIPKVKKQSSRKKTKVWGGLERAALRCAMLD